MIRLDGKVAIVTGVLKVLVVGYRDVWRGLVPRC